MITAGFRWGDHWVRAAAVGSGRGVGEAGAAAGGGGGAVRGEAWHRGLLRGGRIPAGAAYPGDDGSPDPRVSAALDAYVAGRGSEHAALAALAGCRLLVPVVALLTEAEQGGPGGLRRDKSSEMALPTLIGTDGRAAL